MAGDFLKLREGLHFFCVFIHLRNRLEHAVTCLGKCSEILVKLQALEALNPWATGESAAGFAQVSAGPWGGVGGRTQFGLKGFPHVQLGQAGFGFLKSPSFSLFYFYIFISLSHSHAFTHARTNAITHDDNHVHPHHRTRTPCTLRTFTF